MFKFLIHNSEFEHFIIHGQITWANTTEKTRKKNFELVLLPYRDVIDGKPQEWYMKMQQIYSYVQIWRYTYYSKHALSNKPVTLLEIYTD